MKNLIFILLCIVLIGGIIFFLPRDKKAPINPSARVTATPVQPTVESRQEETTLFVPYWSLSKGINTDKDYKTLIYFGITPSESGINKEEIGYRQLASFISQKPSHTQTLLVVRMLNADTNFAVLKAKDKQRQVINDTIAIARANKFNGVVLDLELSALPFDSLIQQINSFAQSFATEANNNELSFSIAMYGDTFYRIRPFEVKTLAKSSDKVMIMAYDFSKANGNPGPGFPLAGKSTYGYDYHSLVDNFLQVVPSEKITVIFGLYGYDWTVDEKNISQQIGKARSLVEIEEQILAKCASLHCQKHRDDASAEMRIEYTDSEGEKHVVWYEDMESVRQKEAYLKTKGITSYSLWANSYF